VSDPDSPLPPSRNGNGNGNGKDIKSPSPGTAAHTSLSDGESGFETPISESEVHTITTLQKGAFAGLPFPHASARANALHVVREHVSTYLITHPHLDHVSGFVINTAAFHNTSRPKRLAALPFTVNAIKQHIFNNVIWPNLTDEDGGVGLVSFQRLAEGGNIALGEGSSRGFIEVCDGLGVKGFKVSHGHCMRGPGHVHRGSIAHVPETPGQPEGRSMSFSLATQSAPGTPGIDGGRRASNMTAVQNDTPADHCVIDSTAYFIRTESTLTTPKREVLIFGDVEPDSISLSPRTAQIWAEAAPKIAAGILTGIFIEVSYTNAQADAVLFGHLAPRHLLEELQVLAGMVKECRKDMEREKKNKKRKRASQTLQLDAGEGRKAKNSYLGVGKGIDSPISATHPLGLTDDEMMSDFNADTGTHTPNQHYNTRSAKSSHPEARKAIDLSGLSAEHNRATLSAAFDSPLKGVKVVIIHVKDSLQDGPLVGDSILRELKEGESVAQEQGRGLGCVFEVSGSGESYWF
jgi:cAMP phosphodiesterase